MKLFGLLLIVHLGNLGTLRCSKNIKGIIILVGTFYGNISRSREHWKPCLGAWCGKRYIAAEDEGYKIVNPQEKEAFVLTLEKERERHLHTRDGDQLMVLYKCNLCYFRNLKGTDPQKKSEDCLLLRIIRRVSLYTI